MQASPAATSPRLAQSAPRAAWRELAFTTLLASFLALGALPRTTLAATEGSGRVATEARSVADFSGISVRGAVTLVVSQGDKVSVSVRADDNLLPLLETVVDGSRLEVGFKKGERIRNHSPVTVTVVTPKLSGLTVAGAGDVELGAFTTPKLKLNIAGSGNARLGGLKADELAVTVAGSGDVRGMGQVGKLEISVAGSGDVRLADLLADEVSVRVAGSGDVAVHANKSLSVGIAGSGDVVYSGEAVVTRSVMGSGTITKR